MKENKRFGKISESGSQDYFEQMFSAKSSVSLSLSFCCTHWESACAGLVISAVGWFHCSLDKLSVSSSPTHKERKIKGIMREGEQRKREKGGYDKM